MRRAGGWPVFGLVSVSAPFLVWLWVNEVFYKPYTGPGGESALVGFFAAGVLCVVGLVLGVVCGVASLLMKERRSIALLGIGCNVATAVTLISILNLR